MDEKGARNKVSEFKDIWFWEITYLNFLIHNFELSVNCNEYD
jgi:hypothetical protein